MTVSRNISEEGKSAMRVLRRVGEDSVGHNSAGVQQPNNVVGRNSAGVQ